MNNESVASVTWQKIAVIVGVGVIVLPVAIGFLWDVVLPRNYLLYEVRPDVRVGSAMVRELAVVNAGHAIQKDVVLYFPPISIEDENATVSVSTPRRSSSRSVFGADFGSSVPLAEYDQNNGFKIPIGVIPPDEEVAIALTFSAENGRLSSYIPSGDFRVESSSVDAVEADGIRRPAYPDDLHSAYVQFAPFLLAIFGGLFVIAMLVSAIYELFFDSPQKKMARLWRQMDQLQSEIEKARRYE